MALPFDGKPLQACRDDRLAKSLTPQRKHRKLLKDGTGGEVWPEHIEALFVRGLRQYWESPYAVFSRGRSRWRNQYLVDYLKSQGIIRSKKQVASHLQVLRNMWKGEPEYHLVAGADEFCAPPEPSNANGGSLSQAKPVQPASRGNRSSNTHVVPTVKPELSDGLSLDFDDSDHSSCNSSPLFSDRLSDFSSSPSSVNTLLYSFESFSPASPDLASLPASSPAPQPYSETSHMAGRPASHHDIGGAAASPSLPCTSKVGQTSVPSHKGRAPVGLAQAAPSGISRRRDHIHVTKFELAAEFMSVFPVDLTAFTSSTSSPAHLNMTLGLPAIDDSRSPPTVHGFSARVCLSRVWSSSARCITQVVAGGSVLSQDIQALDISHIELGTAHVILPDTALTRCRWFDASVETMVTQDIVVDGKTLLHVTYNLDRNPAFGLPRVQFRPAFNGEQLHQNTSYITQRSPGSANTTSFSSPPSHYYQTSLSSALTPYPSYHC